MKKKSIAITAGVLAIAGAAAWYFSQGGAAHDGASAPANGKGKGGGQAPVVVNVITPVRQDVPVTLQVNGTVVPVSSVDLHPQTTATIRKVHIREGQFVKAGELMFTLDDRSDRASVDKAQAQVASDQARLADLERQYKRSEELLAQNFIAQSAADTLRSQVEAQRAALGATRATLQAERVNQSFTAIRAPMAGRVGAIAVFPGSLVQLSTSLTSITQLDPINVGFTVPESALADLLASQKKGDVAVTASAGANARPLSGKLSFIDNAVDPQAGSIKVKAVFDNKDNSLWPGQYVTTQLSVQVIKQAIVIPQSAIIASARGTLVYVMDPDQSARQVPVTRLHGFGANAAVAGLKGDEKIITEGKQNLRPGSKVRLAEAAGAEGAGKGGKGGRAKKAAGE